MSRVIMDPADDPERRIHELEDLMVEMTEEAVSVKLDYEQEVSNLDMAIFIAKTMNKDLKYYEMVDYHSDRPGHDLRYGLDGNKLFNLGFVLPISFEDSLKNTILWTLENKKWLD